MNANDDRPRRVKVREMCDLLHDDLYKRRGDAVIGTLPAARWESPIGWIVIYAYEGSGNELGPVKCEIRKPDDSVYVGHWLESNLP